MTAITDEYMQEILPKAKTYVMVLLKPGPRSDMPGVEKVIWEHGRRNFALRADGLLSIVCPVTKETSVNGCCIFNAPEEQVKTIMDEDPAVEAGIFIYEIHPCMGFPGDSLPH